MSENKPVGTRTSAVQRLMSGKSRMYYETAEFQERMQGRCAGCIQPGTRELLDRCADCGPGCKRWDPKAAS